MSPRFLGGGILLVFVSTLVGGLILFVAAVVKIVGDETKSAQYQQQTKQKTIATLAAFAANKPIATIIAVEDTRCHPDWNTVITAEVNGQRLRITQYSPRRDFEGLENDYRPIFKEGDHVKVTIEGDRLVLKRLLPSEILADYLAPSP